MLQLANYLGFGLIVRLRNWSLMAKVQERDQASSERNALDEEIRELQKTLDENVGKGKGKRFDIAAEYMIGRTLDTRAAHANTRSANPPPDTL